MIAEKPSQKEFYMRANLRPNIVFFDSSDQHYAEALLDSLITQDKRKMKSILNSSHSEKCIVLTKIKSHDDPQSQLISPLQYAAEMGDFDGLTMLIEKIPSSHAKEAQDQLKQMIEEKKGQICLSPSLDFIIQTYSELYDQFDEWDEKTRQDAIDKVNQQLKDLPPHFPRVLVALFRFLNWIIFKYPHPEQTKTEIASIKQMFYEYKEGMTATLEDKIKDLPSLIEEAHQKKARVCVIA